MYQWRKEELKTERDLREVIQEGLENIGLYDRGEKAGNTNSEVSM